MVIALTFMAPAWAQHGEEGHGGQERGAQPQHGEQPRPPNSPRANQGHIPEPPPQRAPAAKPVPERINGYSSNIPHVNNNQWYGHAGPNDARFHLDHPWEHGHFANFGPQYRYPIVRIDPNLHEFWLPGGYYFQIPAWEWPLAEGWCWNCGADDFVIYQDPDHPGWYLLYDLFTGRYIHVIYMGV
jgi:hypothetical protein